MPTTVGAQVVILKHLLCELDNVVSGAYPGTGPFLGLIASIIATKIEATHEEGEGGQWGTGEGLQLGGLCRGLFWQCLRLTAAVKDPESVCSEEVRVALKLGFGLGPGSRKYLRPGDRIRGGDSSLTSVIQS